MPVVEELIAVLGYDLRGEDERRRFERGIDSINTKVRSFALVATRAAAVASGLLAAGMGVAGRSIVRTAAQFEGFQAQLETIEGSSDKARKSLEWISDFGRTTPFEVAELTDAFVRLKSQGIDPIADDALRTLGDASSAMNKPLMQAVEAFTDASTFQFERLKEFGITSSQAGDQVTFRFTKNGKQLEKVVKKNGEEIRRFLLDNFGGRFEGAMDKQSRTFNGIMSNLADAWTDFQTRIADAGFFDAIKDRLKSVMDTIARLDADGTLDKWAKSISGALTFVLDGVSGFVARVKRHFETISDLLEGNSAAFEKWKTPLLVAFGLLWRRLLPVTFFFTVAAVAVDDFLTFMSGGESVIGDFIGWLQEFTGMSESAAQGAALLAGGLLLLALTAGPLRVLSGTLKGLGAAMAAVGLGGAAAGGAKKASKAGKLKGLMGFGPVGTAIGGAAAIIGAEQSMSDEERARLKASQDHERRTFSFKDGVSRADPTSGGAAVDSTINDIRNQSVNIQSNVTVNQSVTEAANAPMAAARATGKATSSAVGSAARVQAEGAR